MVKISKNSANHLKILDLEVFELIMSAFVKYTFCILTFVANRPKSEVIPNVDVKSWSSYYFMVKSLTYQSIGHFKARVSFL